MRKYNIYVKTALVVFAGLLSACSSDNDITENNSANPETPVSNNETMTFSASMDADKVTRTDFNSNSTTWNASDAIKIVNLATITVGGQGTTNKSGVYDIVQHGGGYTKDEVFAGAKIATNGDDKDWFYAVYPSTCSMGIDGVGTNRATIKGSVPTQQTAKKGSYDQSLHFMTAYSTNNTFAFKNVCALLKIKLQNYSNVRKVKVLANANSATNTYYIAGDFETDISTTGGTTPNTFGDGNIKENSNRSPYVELSLPEAGDDCVEGIFYIVVMPRTISNGFTLSIEKTDGTKYMRVNLNLTKFERNKLYDLGTYNCTSTPTDMGVLENYVDLGLPSGTLWCTKNIKAGNGTSTTFVNDIYDDGGYYAWGDVLACDQAGENGTAKTAYSSSTYTLGSEIYSNNLLKYQYDAAYQIAGHLYCMPTYTQIQELYNNCSITDYTGSSNTNRGLLFTSKKNGKTLWLPASGYMCNQGTMNGLQSKNSKSHYWSKTLNSSNTDTAYCLDFDGGSLDGHGWWSEFFIGSGTWYDRRFCGKCIRPVVINKYLAQ